MVAAMSAFKGYFEGMILGSMHYQAAIAQLVARRSHNPKVVSSILTRRIFPLRIKELKE